MRARCRNVGATGSKNYLGRGIKVCDRWNGPDGFKNFLADMGEIPNDGKHYDISRRDNDGDYTPENCEWQTRKQNSRNKRTTRWLMYKGKQCVLAELAERFKIPSSLLSSRIKLGWPEAEWSLPIGTARKETAVSRLATLISRLSADEFDALTRRLALVGITLNKEADQSTT